MKFRKQKEQYTEDYTREGKTVTVNKTRKIPTPVLPRNWDRIGVRAAVTLVLALTMLSVVWSTKSIGDLLDGGIGYAAALIFDLAWAVCLVLEYLARFDKEKRKFPTWLGWALLVATMGAIFWNGLNEGDVSMAVAGAAVSAFAKVLWLGVMKHVHLELSPEDAAWVKATISEANAKRAVAEGRRMAALVEQRASLELLSMERERDATSRAYGLPVQSSAVAPAPVATATTDAVADGAPAPAAIAPAAPAPDIAAIVAAVLAAQNSAVAGGAGADEPQDAEVIEDHQDQEHGYADEEGELLPPLEPPTLSNLSKADAIRIALRKRPELAPAQVAELLSGYDVTVTADYVRQVRNRDQEDAAAAALREAGASGDVVPIRKEA